MSGPDLPGVAGTLFPGRYLRDRLAQDAAEPSDPVVLERQRQHLTRWWAMVSSSYGPTSGMRALFDVVAMPLFGMLGFRARDAVFEARQARAQLLTRSGSCVGLVLLPWGDRPSALWRDLWSAAHEVGAAWCFLLAPPFVSLVDVRGHATRRSLEFTLPEVFDPQSFRPFWLLAHADTFDRSDPATAASTRIDRLLWTAIAYQDRVREDLQLGVVEALGAVGAAIPQRSADTRFEEALTLVYRILFLLFAEARELVPRHDPIYEGAYAVTSLCRRALSGPRRPGLWEALAAVSRLSRLGCRTDDLVVRPFNGRLFARAAAPSLERARPGRHVGRVSTLKDRAIERALVALGSRRDAAGREEISYADLGVEQLGAVYERVLDLDPDVLMQTGHGRTTAPERATVRRRPAHSVRRKTSGTFYTPQPLAEFLVRRTLGPLVAGASADTILSLRVVDPAMGSGAFLVAACRYLAGAYERALIDEGRRVPADFDSDERASIRRLVAERCLAGVDRNPVAVQLARLSLWLTTLARGKPLGFLDHRLRVGDSLIGASPDDLVRIPDRGRSRSGVLPLLDVDGLEHAVRGVVRPLSQLSAHPDDTVADVHAKMTMWQRLTAETSPLHPWRLASTVWCARWFWPKPGAAPPSPAELRAILDALLRNNRTLPGALLAERLSQARAAHRDHAFFHWPLEFCDVFYDETGRPKERPGFDAVLGNPPWEMLRQDGAARHEAVSPIKDPHELVRFVRESGIYPLCDRGHVNLYQPFVERALSLCRREGRIGLVLPWGLAADDGATTLRRRLLDGGGLGTIVGLDNARGIFPIHRGLRFLVAVASPGSKPAEIRARFGVKDAGELNMLPGRDTTLDGSAFPIRLSARQLSTIGGSAVRLPDVRRREDLALLDRLTSQFPPLGSAAGWSARFGRELNVTEDRESFGREGLAVIEGKHLEPFRVNTRTVRRRIARETALELLPDGRFQHARLAYRDVSGVGNRLSLIAAVVPGGVVTTHTVFCLRSALPADALHFLSGLFNSYVLNAIVRMLMSNHLTTSLVEGLPVPPFRSTRIELRIARLARKMVRRPSPELEPRLQAEVARTYGLTSVEFRSVLEGFPLVPGEQRERAAQELEKL